MAGLDFELEFLDQDFLFEYERGNAGSCGLNVDDLFEPESKIKNPVFGDDLSLASALNSSSDDDFLACASTDVSYPLEGFQPVEGTEIAKKLSPWHGSDSGMSDSSPASSPNRAVEEDATLVLSSAQQKLTNMDVLDVNVEDIDFDIDQYSPSSSYTTSPTHIPEDPVVNSNTDNVTFADDLITEEDVQYKHALEFYNSSEMFLPSSNKNKTLKLIKVQHVDVPEDKSRKNAIQAKINREKKKAYIKSLEDEISTLRSGNAKLTSENKIMQSNMSELEEEVEYLKSVLVNSSSLSSLLKNISNVNEVKLSATLIGKKRSVSDDHSYESVPQKRARRINENLKKAGVCLHVNGGSASLEFCAHCSKLAHKSCLS